MLILAAGGMIPYLSSVGGGVGRLMANAILNFHFDFLKPSLTWSSCSKPGASKLTPTHVQNRHKHIDINYLRKLETPFVTVTLDLQFSCWSIQRFIQTSHQAPGYTF